MTDFHDVSVYAASIRITFEQPLSSDRARTFLQTIMGGQYKTCSEMNATLIGHIKCLAECPGVGFMACSITDMDGSISCSGTYSSPLSMMNVILNVLVYGVDPGIFKKRMESQIVRSLRDIKASGSIINLNVGDKCQMNLE
jgi:hypothetical protein